RPESRAGGARAAVLPEVPDITVRRDEQMRWLVMRAEPEAVWPKVRDFWIDQGFELTETNARVGVLQTDWAEDRAEIPAGGIGKLLGKLYSASFRDKYRTRLERGSSPGTTEIYVAHRGLREVITEGGGTETVQTGWETRPSDPGLEAEMLARLMVSLGAEDSKSQARERVAGAEPRPPRARLIDADGAPALELDERFARAWRITGLALDRGGFTVEDRNRDQGVYYVRYRPAPAAKRGGFLSSLAFWRDNAGQDEAKRYQIALVSAGEETRVVVREPSGERSASETARRILRLLHEELR
ncbi:MAG: outer membrane protein assembly factor BamC, partial [Gammaproteobacteria bacterium]|nr:outer membrane protein assembly factor BamC [Gammaproteobacteria bacterium]